MLPQIRPIVESPHLVDFAEATKAREHMTEASWSGPPLPIVSLSDLEQDAHALYRRYRSHWPVIRREDGVWIVLRAADVRRIAGDPRVISPEMMAFRAGPLADFSKRIMLFSNGDTHVRRRAPFAKLLAPPAVIKLRAKIRAVAESEIDGWPPQGEADLVSVFAARVPARVVGHLLGLPAADVAVFARLTRSVARFLGSANFGDLHIMEADLLHLNRRIEHLFASRRAAPCDDFITSYLSTLDASDSLSSEEAVAQIAFLLGAATDTARFALAAQTALLLTHREQWERVCREPARWHGAVVESQRFEPSVGSYHRLTRQELVVGGCVIPAGAIVMLACLSALRDESVYAEPDRFDILRTDHPKGHAAFGGGPHRCLGEALALMLLEEGLGALATRLPKMRLVGEPPTPRGHSGIRCLESVRVSWS